MEYKGYLAKVEYDDEAKLIHGEVLGIRDVVTFQAHRASQTEQAFHNSVDDYITFCMARGEEPDKPFPRQDFCISLADPTCPHPSQTHNLSRTFAVTCSKVFASNPATGT